MKISFIKEHAIETTLLMPILMEHVNWNQARVNFLANFLVALLKVKTVNLVEIAAGFTGKAKKESSYRRIQRFLSLFPIDFTFIAKLVVSMLGVKDLPWTLTMDRTNWKFGKLNINILVLGIAYKGSAFPLIWILLPKAGNSNTQERIQLLEIFIKIFSIVKIECLLADREFIGEDWFAYLLDQSRPISFRIRIRENMNVSNSRGRLVPVKHLFRHLRIGQSEILKGKRIVCGHRLFVIGLRLKGEFCIIVTDKNPETALADYLKRWEIETLFGCFKTRGFCFEDTHLNDLERIKKLIALLAITFCWAHITGEWLHELKPIKIKKHGRNAISLFRYGFDHLRNILLNISRKLHDFQLVVSLLFQNTLSPASP